MWQLVLSFFLVFLSACSDESSIYDQLDLEINNAKTFGSPLLKRYDACESLEQDLRDSRREQMSADLAVMAKNFDKRYIALPENDMALDGVPTATPVSAPATTNESGSGPQEGIDFSGTNNQEKGIDEADIIKLDGKYFYIVNKDTIEIVSVEQPGTLQKASTLNLGVSPKSLLLLGDKAVVFSGVNDQFSIDSAVAEPAFLSLPRRFHSNTRVDVIDLSADRSAPSVTETHYFDGEFVAARKIKDKIHVSTYASGDVEGIQNYPESYFPENFYDLSKAEQKREYLSALEKMREKNNQAIDSFSFLKLVPGKLEKVGDEYRSQDLTTADCRQTFTTEKGSSLGFLSLISLDFENSDETNIEMQRVRGNRPTVYASNDQIILASKEHDDWWFFGNSSLKDQTNIHRFDLSSDDMPNYFGSVRVPGTLHNSFSMSEHEGYLRVATTTRSQREFDELTSTLVEEIPEENHLFVVGDVEDQLQVVSSIEGLAPGERIWSARFTQDKGFLVTFEQVDPLFTLDLSDPLAPKVAGELKLPGVSTYLQDIGDDNLLAIGYGGDEEGLDFNTTISLFDVSDFSSPNLASTLSFAPSGSDNNNWSSASSEANQNHLAINYFAPVSMTAIPINTNRFVQNSLDPQGGRHEYKSELVLVNTEPGEELSIKGRVDHSPFYNDNSNNYYGSHQSQVRRSYFFNDFIYAISSKGITANRLSNMQQTASYAIP